MRKIIFILLVTMIPSFLFSKEWFLNSYFEESAPESHPAWLREKDDITNELKAEFPGINEPEMKEKISIARANWLFEYKKLNWDKIAIYRLNRKEVRIARWFADRDDGKVYESTNIYKYKKESKNKVIFESDNEVDIHLILRDDGYVEFRLQTRTPRVYLERIGEIESE